MNNMVVVVKPQSGDTFNELMTFLEEKRLEFSVRCSEPIKEAPASSRASEDIDFSAAKNIQEVSNLEVQRITSNDSEISDNLADNDKLRIPKEESEKSEDVQLAPIAHVKTETGTVGEPINVPELHAPTRSSENNDSPSAAKKMRLELNAQKIPETSNFEIRKIPSFQSDNLANNPIAHIEYEQFDDDDDWKYQRWGLKRHTCKVCGKKIDNATGYIRKQHAIHHLKLRTWKCTRCNSFFKNSGPGSDHFRSTHPGVPYTRLVDTISDEEKRQVDEMQVRCFPSQPIHRMKYQNDN
ncbi:hypothetical protein B9Z55_021461 [Caenorhabditis nigoni]|uniref:C2H2-type domain-containing protein n=1 Tax=Caenorhabditis nigoni TaxID=1611254 RepID=A0A2G5TS16_9PELO|nr:hypothetical protein B9Z55_021461 [Caenorhabditis nigoni]